MDILPTLASGLAGWLTFEDMLRNVRHHQESALHEPILRLAQNNGFSVAREFPLPRVPGQVGAPKQVDFVLGSERRRELVALELKFKKTAMAMAGSVTADARKLAQVGGGDLNATLSTRTDIKLPHWEAGWRLRRAVLLVWREGDVAHAMLSKREDHVIRKQMKGLLNGLCADPDTATPKEVARAMVGSVPIRPVDNVEGHLRFGSTKTSNRYWVAILKHRPSWNAL